MIIDPKEKKIEEISLKNQEESKETKSKEKQDKKNKKKKNKSCFKSLGRSSRNKI